MLDTHCFKPIKYVISVLMILGCGCYYCYPSYRCGHQHRGVRFPAERHTFSEWHSRGFWLSVRFSKVHTCTLRYSSL